MSKVRVPQLTRDLCSTPRPGHTEQVEFVSRPIQAALLVAKLHSEAEEIANDLTNAEEYGDLLESLVALATLNGVPFEAVIAAATEKRRVKGGLDRGLFWMPEQFITTITKAA